jgi:hypothetical protein
MRRKTGLIIAMLLISAITVPFFALQVHGTTNAGPDQTAYINATVAFNGTTTENTSSIVNVNWNFGDQSTPVNGSNPNLLNTTTHSYNATGNYTVTLSVSYNSVLNKTETDTLTVAVVVNVPPSAEAGPDQTVEQTTPEGANVTLDGSASSDQYGDPLTYNWTWSAGSAIGVSPTVMLPPGMTNVTLTVDDGVFNATDIVTITIADTTPPSVDAGPDMTVEAVSPAGAEVTLYGNATDAVDMDLDFVWSEGDTVLGNESSLTATLTLGTHTLTLNATDDSGNTGTDTVMVDVVDTTPPSVDAGPDMTVEAVSPAGAEVTLYGNATDAVDMDLDFVWSEGDTILGNESSLTATLTLGTHTLTLNATDDSGNTGTDTVMVDVVDTTPPEINILVNPDIMWPPNHKYVDVETVVTVHDAVDTSPTLTLVSVTSNEPDNGKGDGNTTNDIEILSDTMFRLRAERSGKGQGRIYTITYGAEDASGNYAEASITITVPHNQ